jgi:hypothetical protein
MMMMWVVLSAGMWLFGRILLPHVLLFLTEHGLLGGNYRHERIPLGTGMFLWLMLLAYLFALAVLRRFSAAPELPFSGDRLHIYAIALTAVFFAGWLDDTIGEQKVKGLKGHLRKWREERIVTTGLVKALATVFMALFAVAGSAGGIVSGMLQFLLLLLMTNALNLLDLRPGRAIKGFLMLALFTFAFGSWTAAFIFLLPLAVGALLVFPADLRAKAMLGDSGANLLGFALGFAMIHTTPAWWQLALCVLLAGLHWLAEKSSVSYWIENIAFLKKLDQWGRV